MFNIFYIYMAAALLIVVILREQLKKRCNVDMDKIEVSNLLQSAKNLKSKYIKTLPIINKKTGTKNLIFVNAGENKAVVLSTLRQITEFDKEQAQMVIEKAPYTFMKNISDREAKITKQALEFVGAEIQIK